MILVVHGDDALRVKERTDALRAHFAQKYDQAAMNVDEVFWKVEADTGLARELTRANPFMAEKRLVIVRGAMDGATKPITAIWRAVVEGLPASTVLLFADVITTAEENNLYKLLKEMPDAHFYPMESLRGAAFSTWLSDRSKQMGLRFSPTAWTMFSSRVQDEPARALLELQKLTAYAGNSQLEVATIELMVAGVPEEDIFGFMDSLERGGAIALKRLRQERAAGAQAFPMFGMLSRQNRLLLLAASVAGQGEATISKVLGIPGFAARKLISAGKRLPFAGLKRAHARLTYLDAQMKSGLDGEMAVDRAIADLLPADKS